MLSSDNGMEYNFVFYESIESLFRIVRYSIWPEFTSYFFLNFTVVRLVCNQITDLGKKLEIQQHTLDLFFFVRYYTGGY